MKTQMNHGTPLFTRNIFSAVSRLGSAASRGGLALAFLLGASAFAGCSAKAQSLGGETNWLKTCEVDGECASDSCVCGVCSSSCSEASQCSGYAGASCEETASEAVGRQCAEESSGSRPSAGLCLPGCTRDGECSVGQECAAGACIWPTKSPSASGPGGGTQRVVVNPTGDCNATDNGASGDQVPDKTDVYLPDCELTLSREYYRVFVQSDDTAYMYPRPDQHPSLALQCQQTEAALTLTLNRYKLCQNTTELALVNAMDPKDALEIAHFLHEQLVFYPAENGVWPYPKSDDILAACKSDSDFAKGLMKERCEFELEAEASGQRTSIGWDTTPDQAVVLADKLNELYGVENDELCQRLSRDASLSLFRVIDASGGPCETAADCVEVGQNSACHDSCGAVAAVSKQPEIGAAREQVGAGQCGVWERADCGPVIAPPCPALGLVACVANRCQVAP